MVPGTRRGFITVQHITDSEDLVDKVPFLFGHFFRREAFPLDIEFMFFPVGFRFPHALVVEIIFQFLTPVNAARIDYITKKVRRDGIYPDIKNIVASMPFLREMVNMSSIRTNFVVSVYVFLPKRSGTMCCRWRMLFYTGTAYLHAATGKEEHLRIMGIIGKVQFYFLQIVQGRI